MHRLWTLGLLQRRWAPVPTVQCERVPAALIEQWRHAEAEMEQQDMAENEKARIRNEVERHMLQLKTRVAGDWAEFVPADDQAKLDRLLASARDVLARGDTQDASPEVNRLSHIRCMYRCCT